MSYNLRKFIAYPSYSISSIKGEIMKKRFFLPSLLAFASLFSFFLSQTPSNALAPTAATVNYTASNSDFANPERGLYHHVETRGSSPNAYSLTQLQNYRTNENITLIYCINVLDTFVTTNISQTFLDHIQSNFDTVRAAGLKCILRFSYTDIVNGGNGSWPPVPPYGDATKAQMLAHIEQLRPLIQANSDVIATMHRGFIGIWGEGYYTDHFLDDPTQPSTISATQWQNRFDILEALLNALPPSRMVAVRYAEAKQNMFGTTTALTQAQAHEGSLLARTSYHNDCFLASDFDFGTWQDAAGKTYMSDESKFVTYGGETCFVNHPRSLCPTAQAEVALFHWSYLNIEYHPDVLDDWDMGGCLDIIRKNLGYRFVLQSGTYDDSARPGHQFNVNLSLDNVGYAAPFTPRLVQLLLRNQSTGDIYAATLPEDPRFWFAGETAVLNHNICLPNDIPTGSYDLLLNLPDRAPSLRTRAEYASLFANDGGVQETSTGYNKLLHTLTVSAGAPATACSNAVDAALFTAPPSSPSVMATLDGGNVDLTWLAQAVNCSLNLYDDVEPYFATSADAIYDDTLAAATAAYEVSLETAAHYYLVEAVGCDGTQTAVSNRVGSFPFAIQPGSS
ncbi:MAG: DUF4832 domain-containing protein [Chloroflexota bacterium]